MEKKIHEDLITKSDSLSTYENKNYYIIFPDTKKLNSKLRDLKRYLLISVITVDIINL